MKSNFKYIVFGIIFCLSLVFVWQIFWLKGLYNSINADIERNVLECIDIADIEEVKARIKFLEKDSTQTGTVTINQSIGKNEEEQRDGVMRTVTLERDSVSEETVSQQMSSDENEELELNLEMLRELLRKMVEGMHLAIDPMLPINFAVLDSALVANFEQKGIKSKLYYIEIINNETGEVIQSSRQDSIANETGQAFTYVFDSENKTAYRIHIEPLSKTVLWQMSGILGTTFLIILLLGFAFWYLIRTVLRQKTLEEMKDDFTNNMTHELKTPIAVAYSAADALLNFKQGDDKEKREKYLSICKDQLSELSGLVEQILSMSMERRKTFILNKEDVDVKRLIDSLTDQHKLKSEKPVVFNTYIEPENLTINADRAHLNNMISNLIDNAIKYSAEEVRVDISVYQKDNYYRIDVKDNGIGIASDKQAYVFDKFYRVTHGNKYTVKGYGLGLFYVKTMAEKHQGDVAVSSSLGNGSTFTIKIPV